MADRRAAVDIGTNSCRLLVLDETGRSLARALEITRLGAGVDASGSLDDAAVERTLEVLRRFREIWEGHGVVSRVRIGATSAIRDAKDRQRFLTAVEEAVGIPAEVITGDREAQLSFTGATGALDVRPPALVLDVGGGSTELVVGTPGEPGSLVAVSLQLGSVRLTERFLPSDPPGSGEIARARMEAAQRVDEASTALRIAGDEALHVPSIVGVAGTVTTLAMLISGARTYTQGSVHGTAISVDDVRIWSDRLLRSSHAKIAALGAVQTGREDVIAGGALIVRTVMERMRFHRMVVSEHDSLDALAAEA